MIPGDYGITKAALQHVVGNSYSAGDCSSLKKVLIIIFFHYMAGKINNIKSKAPRQKE